MIKKILVGIAAALLALAALIAVQPATFRVERSLDIAASPEAVRALVNDFHAWRSWSPWEKRDPHLQRSFDGAASGAGAKYAWRGNDQVGEGRMTIVHSDPARVVIALEFLKPFAATNTAVFTFSDTARGTKTTWAMEGRNDFTSKAFHLLMDMDKAVGSDFERGLQSIEAIAAARGSASVATATAPGANP